MRHSDTHAHTHPTHTHEYTLSHTRTQWGDTRRTRAHRRLYRLRRRRRAAAAASEKSIPSDRGAAAYRTEQRFLHHNTKKNTPPFVLHERNSHTCIHARHITKYHTKPNAPRQLLYCLFVHVATQSNILTITYNVMRWWGKIREAQNARWQTRPTVSSDGVIAVGFFCSLVERQATHRWIGKRYRSYTIGTNSLLKLINEFMLASSSYVRQERAHTNTHIHGIR